MEPRYREPAGERVALARRPHGRLLIVRRGTSLGLLGGGIAGLALGTCLLPLIGSAIGLVLGGLLGLCVGFPAAATLAVLADLLTDPPRARLAGGVAGLGWGWTALAVLGWAGYAGWTFVGLLACVIVGVVVGPFAVFERVRAPHLPPATPQRAR